MPPAAPWIAIQPAALDALQVHVDAEAVSVSYSNTPWRADVRVTAGQGQILEVSKPFEVRVRGEQSLPTPDRAVGPISGAIKGEPDHPPLVQSIVRHTGGNMRVMMLDSNALDWRTFGKAGREIIRM